MMTNKNKQLLIFTRIFNLILFILNVRIKDTIFKISITILRKTIKELFIKILNKSCVYRTRYL